MTSRLPDAAEPPHETIAALHWAAEAPKVGVPHHLDAHHRLLPGPDDLVLVTTGVVEVFLDSDARPAVAPRHLGTLTAGQALPGTRWAGELAGSERVVLIGNGPALARHVSDGAALAHSSDDQFRREELGAAMARLRGERDSATVIERRVAADVGWRRGAEDALAKVLGKAAEPHPPGGAPDAPPRLRALLLAADAAGLRPAPAAVERVGTSVDRDVPHLASRLRIPVRQVDPGGRWWDEDGPPIVAEDADGNPYALARRGRRWQVWSAREPSAGWRPARQALAGTPAAAGFSRAWCVYPALPDRPLTPKDLTRAGLAPGWRRDLGWLVASALAVTALGASVPLATSRILGYEVPRAEAGNVLAIAVLVGGLVLAFSVATVAQGLLLQRLVAQVNGRTTAALWARVVRLDPPFFRSFNPGELARRVLAVDSMRDLVTSSVLTGGIGLLIGLTGLVIALVLDPVVGAAVAAGLVCYTGYAYRLVRRLVRARRVDVTTGNTISGLVTSMLTGIAKVRVAGAEQRMFARWGQLYATQQAAAARGYTATRQLTVITAIAPALGTLVVLATTAYGRDATLNVGVFVGLIAALGQVTTALTLITPAVTQLADLAPLYDSARPVLRTAPRPVTDAADPGTLTGRIELSKVSFAYTEDGPPVLRTVDLTAAPGEFVAVVGPSGAGKSTLIRLLLGFDRPAAGTVLLDGRPLDTLDVEAVRRQIGVVMQNAQVPTGSILTCLVGIGNLTQQDAWAALEMAGLADDVRQMPMGIQTVVSEGGATFSGGQRQRLMIARALIRQPKILVFDEATSALDNITQRTVTRSIEQLDATRIVIAHRLSTIRDAHRIYVLDRGAVVEVGDYPTLLAAGGVFAELARRQLA